MIAADYLLVAIVFVPLLMAVGCLSSVLRVRMPLLLVLAPLPALLAALFVSDTKFNLFALPFGLTLMIDRPGAIILGGSALLWSAAGAYATFYMRHARETPQFAIWWLLTLAGSLGLFIVGDVVNFYLLFTLASLAAYGLIIHEQTAAASRAGAIYVGLALVAEAFLLLALVLLAAGHPEANPQIREVVTALPTSTMRDGIVALLVLGFALKMGLFPLHVWLPIAHPAAPLPASAVLSGVVVKAGVIGLLRFLPFEAGLADWGNVLIGIGILTAYYGVIIGVTQTHPKTVLAYSTVSQMGLIAVLIGVGLVNADAGAPILVAYYAIHHTLVKGALFLAIGIVAATGAIRSRLWLLLTGILALSLGGMPLTSGALAKLATKPMLGAGFVEHAMVLAGAGSTLLMTHFILIVVHASRKSPAKPAQAGQIASWLVVAIASLVAPWSLYPEITGESIASLLAPGSLWKVAWPMLLGVSALVVVRRLTFLTGSVPGGDIIVFAEVAGPLVRRAASGVEWIDVILRRWQVAGMWLVGLVTMFWVALMLRS